MARYRKVQLGKEEKVKNDSVKYKNLYRFGGFEELKKYMADERGQLNSKTRLLCGLGAGVCNQLVLSINL